MESKRRKLLPEAYHDFWNKVILIPVVQVQTIHMSKFDPVDLEGPTGKKKAKLTKQQRREDLLSRTVKKVLFCLASSPPDTRMIHPK